MCESGAKYAYPLWLSSSKIARLEEANRKAGDKGKRMSQVNKSNMMKGSSSSKSKTKHWYIFPVCDE